MSKAEDLSKKAYPEGDIYIFGDASVACQVAYVKGYQQAEKDLELSWEDVKLLIDIVDSESLEPHLFDEIDYQEVLKRFKDLKNGTTRK